MCVEKTENVKVFVPARLSYTGKDRRTEKPIDACIAPIVKALNDAKIRTDASCCGHGFREGEIVLNDGRVLRVEREKKT